MIRNEDRELARHIDEALIVFHQTIRSLPGVQDDHRRHTFLAQIIESTRRIRYVTRVTERDVSDRRVDPNDGMFDPLKAAIVFDRRGEIDEAFWMVFYFVHFGKHIRRGWKYASDIYGRLGDPLNRWDWAATSADPAGFRHWLAASIDRIKSSGASGGFGNHRKYQSLDAYSDSGTGAAFETYTRWVGPPRTHEELISSALQKAHQNPFQGFSELYQSMNSVASFGRTARFDYLTMIGKLGLATIEPPSPYLPNSTGPLHGARTLFGVQETPSLLDQWIVELGTEVGVGVQVLEDALCNWQKSPKIFVPFRG